MKVGKTNSRSSLKAIEKIEILLLNSQMFSQSELGKLAYKNNCICISKAINRKTSINHRLRNRKTDLCLRSLLDISITKQLELLRND